MRYSHVGKTFRLKRVMMVNSRQDHDQPVPPGPEVQRERILRSAAKALADSGFEGARLRDVAADVGVSIGLLQHYFETRDLLFHAAFAWSIDELISRWECAAVGESDPWRRMELLVTQLTTDEDLLRRCTTWIEFCASASRHEELQDGVARVYESWRLLVQDVVARGVQDGTFRPALDQATAVDLICTLVDGCDLAVASRSQRLTPGRYRDLVLDTAALALGVNAHPRADPAAKKAARATGRRAPAPRGALS